MFKKIFFFFCFAACCFSVFSQVSSDPGAVIYEDIVIWENLGIVKNLSPLRPYPLAVIEDILKTVIDCPYPIQAQKAQEYFDRIFSKPVSAGLSYETRLKFADGNEALVQNNLNVLCFGDFYMAGRTSVSLDLKVHATDGFRAAVLPQFARPLEDAPWDPVDMGKFTGLLDMNMSAASVFDGLYVQLGISRNSWGPFFDSGVTLSKDSFHNGNITFFYNGHDKWNYQHSYFMLGATDNTGNRISPEKFMALHSIEYSPWSWLTFSYYENIIYGNRFDPIYVLPVPFMVAQSIGSYSDNLQMGVAFEVRPFPGFLWASDVLVDDISANELLRLDFDTKIKIAAVSGVQYAFNTSVVKMLGLDYTLIAPYMYTHEDSTVINYQNYTNNGICMGSDLPPNSDRIALRLSLEPVKNLSVMVKGSFARHANINESIPDDDAISYLRNYGIRNSSVTDGGIHNYANAGAGYLGYAQENFMFMDQDTKMLIVQTALDASYTFYTSSAGNISLNTGWTFEFIKNKGVQNAMFGFSKPDATAADVESAREVWKAALHNTLANYVYFSIRYAY